MAVRPVYIPCYESDVLVRTEMVEFKWFAGMSVSQKQKSIESLHLAAKESGICGSILEVSSKSPIELGVSLSAFNLGSETEGLKKGFTVETAFQSSKVFKNGGPYKDLLHGSSIAAKKDQRLRESGELVCFEFFGINWPLEPKTAFYDWLYINTLIKNEKFFDGLSEYDGFTDIEFNPEKSINCQAYSVALFKSLKVRGFLNDKIKTKDGYLEMVSERPISTAYENTELQSQLF